MTDTAAPGQARQDAATAAAEPRSAPPRHGGTPALAVARARSARLRAELQDARSCGMATGIVMAWCGLAEDDAVALLEEMARHDRRTVREVADEIVAKVNAEHRR